MYNYEIIFGHWLGTYSELILALLNAFITTCEW